MIVLLVVFGFAALVGAPLVLVALLGGGMD